MVLKSLPGRRKWPDYRSFLIEGAVFVSASFLFLGFLLTLRFCCANAIFLYSRCIFGAFT